MPKLVEKSSKIANLLPGTPVYTGDETAGRVKITVIEYDSERFNKKEIEDINEIKQYKDPKTVKWINIDGLYRKDIIESVGKNFNIHPLLLEDIMDTHQRPKIENYDEYVFIVLKMIYYEEEVKGEEEEIVIEQVSLVLGKDFVVSFQEDPGKDVFDRTRDRISHNKGLIRKMGADFLAYSLVDSIVDSYFAIFERFGGEIEELDKELIEDSEKEDLTTLHDLKRDLIFLKKSVWPLREVIGGMRRMRSSLITDNTRLYLRDVYDHTIHLMDTIETYKDVLSSMIDMYLSSVSNKLNEVMKVLTIIATIFIPLTFITGLYGMNFKYMPELTSSWGYPGALLFMIAIAVVMIIYFKRNKWF